MPLIASAVKSGAQPYFSICVPQHNRTSFFLEALRSIVEQSIDDYEICISDDCSTDGRQDEIVQFLQHSGVAFQYFRQEANVRYDANLRTAMSLARGQYIFLLGNDDCLAASTTLEVVRDRVQEVPDDIGVVIPNFMDWATCSVRRRVNGTGVAGRGPDVVVQYYREFSFLSGIMLDARRALAHQSTAYDGSEMYQMYIGSRILAEGAALLTLDIPIVRKDIQIAGERVDSLATKPKTRGWRVVPRRVPVLEIPRLVTNAIEASVDASTLSRYAERIILQFLLFTFPYWVVEFKYVHSVGYSIGFCLAARVNCLCDGVELGWGRLMRLRLVHLAISVAGLAVPVWLFRGLYPTLYRLAKARLGLRESLRRGIAARAVQYP
ncbi:MAG TPA: glycosyltransferase family 2 protein [Candidatus Acidoferrum sp.]|nr:glycosyltransferase family 2 protein [Candidatus Acidoferrum sp.]